MLETCLAAMHRLKYGAMHGLKSAHTAIDSIRGTYGRAKGATTEGKMGMGSQDPAMRRESYRKIVCHEG